MDTQPHTPIETLSESFKGLVALVITNDCPFGFSNKQHHLFTGTVAFRQFMLPSPSRSDPLGGTGLHPSFRSHDLYSRQKSKLDFLPRV